MIYSAGHSGVFWAPFTGMGVSGLALEGILMQSVLLGCILAVVVPPHLYLVSVKPLNYIGSILTLSCVAFPTQLFSNSALSPPWTRLSRQLTNLALQNKVVGLLILTWFQYPIHIDHLRNYLSSSLNQPCSTTAAPSALRQVLGRQFVHRHSAMEMGCAFEQPKVIVSVAGLGLCPLGA